MAASDSVPQAGFQEFGVPEMPSYIQGYTKRGNAYDGETQPVYMQTRWGNPRYKGGMSAYLSQVEDTTYFEGEKQKLGDHGVYEQLRWAPGQDWRGNFGIASLDSSKNYRIQTRGGALRAGGPRRQDYFDRPNHWFETTRPGIAVSRYSQSNDNYSGVYDYKRKTPIVERSSDMFELRQMIEHNPFHIASHAAAQAKKEYDQHFQPSTEDSGFQAYNDGLGPDKSKNKVRYEKRVISDQDPYFSWLDKYPLLH